MPKTKAQVLQPAQANQPKNNKKKKQQQQQQTALAQQRANQSNNAPKEKLKTITVTTSTKPSSQAAVTSGDAVVVSRSLLFHTLLGLALCLVVLLVWVQVSRLEQQEVVNMLGQVQHKAADLRNEVEKIVNSTQEMIREWNTEVVGDLLSSFDMKFFPRARDHVADSARPGLLHAKAFPPPPKGQVHPVHPIVLFPGFITSQLEVWQGKQCADAFFTHSIWGSLSMVELMLRKPYCWIEHMSLDPLTGLDPEGAHSFVGDCSHVVGIKLRAVQSIHGISHLFPGFWVFGKLIQNLADIGYDSSTLYSANYDWRLSPQLLEERDGFCSKLKKNIESLVETRKAKVVVIAHSLGGAYYFYFMQWVTHKDPLWIHKHVHVCFSQYASHSDFQAFINAGGALLGTAKAYPALISGEMKDSADLELGRAYLADAVISPLDRLAMIRSWPAVPSLLPKGLNLVWGDETSSPEDVIESEEAEENGSDANGEIGVGEYAANANGATKATEASEDKPKEGEAPASAESPSPKYLIRFTNGTGLTYEASLRFLRERLEQGDVPLKEEEGKETQNLGKIHWQRIEENYNFDFKTEKTGFNSPLEPRDWTSPLTSPLPYAPLMKIYCLYGVGKPTERGFYYHDWDDNDKGSAQMNATEQKVHRLNGIRYSIATNMGSAGILLGDGDGTVPLASLGYMCVDAWKQKFYNPSGTKIITREYYHNPAPILSSFDPRGGATTADHVDILGNHEYLDDILRIVSGSDSRDGDRILSRIKHVSRRITARAQAYAEEKERERERLLAQQQVGEQRVSSEEEEDRSR